MTTTAHHKLLIMFLFVFSVSLALSKTAANVLMTLIYLAGLILIVRYQEDRRSILSSIKQPLVIPLLAYLAVSVIGIIYTEKLADGLGIANKVAGLFLVYFMTSVVIDAVRGTDERAKLTDKLLLIFIAGVLVLDVIGFLTYLGIFADRKFSLPVSPMHVHHIWFANINAVGLYAAISFFLPGHGSHRSGKNALFAAFLPLSALSILFSTSRTAWLGLIVTGLVLTYLYSGKKRIFFLVLGSFAVLCVLSYLFLPIVQDRVNIGIADIAQYAGGNKETSMGWRFLMWKAALSMFLSNPVFGIGTGDYVVTMHRYIESGAYPSSLLQFNQPHNMYLFALATNGLLGLGALLFIFFRIFVVTRPFREIPHGQKQLFFFATAVAIHYLVAGMTDSLFNIFILRLSFAFVMGICIRTGSVQPAGSG
jgi:O-antigen ligase